MDGKLKNPTTGDTLHVETEAGAVKYGAKKLNNVLSQLGNTNTTEFGKKLLTVEDKSELNRVLEITPPEIKDECGNPWYSSTGASVLPAQYKFGSSALSLNSGKNLQTTHSLVFGDDPFTVSFWVYMSSFVISQNIFRALGTKGSFGFINSSASLKEIWFRIGTTAANSAAGSNPYVASTTLVGKWVHVEFAYNGSGKLYQFVGGKLIATASKTFNREARRIIFGGFAGYIDEFRILDGVCAHTGAFSVPTSPYELTEKTISLLHFE